AWHLAGRPQPDHRPWGSFEAWGRVVRCVMLWAGLGDPCASQSDKPRDIDPATEEGRELVRALLELQQPRMKRTTKQLMGEYESGAPGLVEWIDARASEANRAANSQRLGKWLSRYEGLVTEDHQLRSAMGHRKTKLWFLYPVGDGQEAASEGVRSPGDSLHTPSTTTHVEEFRSYHNEFSDEVDPRDSF
ncbi:MAG: hypothetical protein AAGH15_09525, partial [Myxococcota bacterium]